MDQWLVGRWVHIIYGHFLSYISIQKSKLLIDNIYFYVFKLGTSSIFPCTSFLVSCQVGLIKTCVVSGVSTGSALGPSLFFYCFSMCTAVACILDSSMHLGIFVLCNHGVQNNDCSLSSVCKLLSTIGFNEDFSHAESREINHARWNNGIEPQWQQPHAFNLQGNTWITHPLLKYFVLQHSWYIPKVWGSMVLAMTHSANAHWPPLPSQESY